MKKVLFFVCILSSVMFLSAQNDQATTMMQRVNELSGSVSQAERQIRSLQRELKVMDEKLNQGLSDFTSSQEKKNQLINEQFQSFQEMIQQDVSQLRDEVDNQKSFREKIHKRQKIHFIILYILLFAVLMGVVFIFFYYSKLLKDFDIFQHKCMNDLKNEMISMINESKQVAHTQLEDTSRNIQKQFNEINGLILETQKNSKESIESYTASLENKLSDLNNKLEHTQNMQADHLKIIESNSTMRKDIEILSEVLQKLKQELEIEFNMLKKADSEMMTELSAKIQRISQSLHGHQSKKPREDA